VRNKLKVRSVLLVAYMIFCAVPAIANRGESKTYFIQIKQLKFSSDVITVKPGDTVTWVNDDFVPHNVTAKDKSWSTGNINHGESRSIVVTQKFELSYFCLYHPSMQAQLEV